MTDTTRIAATSIQKVVVVNGNTDVLGMLEAVLEAGRYDMVFVESSDHAYSQIKKVLPNLVILCARVENLEGFQLLTMLKLDADTRDIPVLPTPLSPKVRTSMLPSRSWPRKRKTSFRVVQPSA